MSSIGQVALEGPRNSMAAPNAGAADKPSTKLKAAAKTVETSVIFAVFIVFPLPIRDPES